MEQLAHIAAAGHSRADVKLVTLSIGINDIGFAEIINDCVNVPPAGAIFGPHGKFGCNGRDSALTDQALTFLAEDMPAGAYELPGINVSGTRDLVVGPRQSLTDVYAEIHRRAPNARILVLGYPQLWGDSFSPDVYGRGTGTCLVGTAFGSILLKVDWPDSRWMNEVSKGLDSVVQDAVTTVAGLGADIRYIDTLPAFVGKKLDYRLCGRTGSPRLRALDLHGTDPLMVSFHPKDSGQQAIAPLVIAKA